MRAPSSPTPRAMRWVVLGLVGVSGCEASEDPPPGRGGAATEETTGGTAAGMPRDIRPTSECESAPLRPLGAYHGSLADSVPMPALCGDGPSSFARVRVTAPSDVFVRSRGRDFRTSVGVSDAGCGSATPVCGGPEGVWLHDVAAETELTIQVSGDLAALDEDSSRAAFDYAVELATRPIRSEGAPCSPRGLDRCASGLQCVADKQDVPRCATAPGEVCRTAAPVELDVAAATVTLQAQARDDHWHSCGGARRGDTVLDLRATGPSTDAAVRIDGLPAGAIVAARNPTCFPDDEIACTEVIVGDTLVALGEAWAASAHSAYLFVEWPSGTDPGEVEVTLSRVPGTP